MTRLAAAMCIAVGKESFDDWLMLTWSLGCTGFLAAELAAEQLVGAVGDDLVEVHVALGARAGLPHDKREMIVELALDHLARGADDGVGAALVEQAELEVGLCGRKLDDAERMHERDRHAVDADAEILARAFGLRPPIAIGGDFDGTETVGLDAGRGAGESSQLWP